MKEIETKYYRHRYQFIYKIDAALLYKVYLLLQTMSINISEFDIPSDIVDEYIFANNSNCFIPQLEQMKGPVNDPYIKNIFIRIIKFFSDNFNSLIIVNHACH